MKGLGLVTTYNRLLISEYVKDTFDLDCFECDWGYACYHDEEGNRLDTDALKMTESKAHGLGKVFYIYYDEFYGIEVDTAFTEVDLIPMTGYEPKDCRLFSEDLPFQKG